MKDRSKRVRIIGGSLAGPAAEILFRKAGFADVATYEASPKPHPQSGGVLGIRDGAAAMLSHAGVPMARAMALESPDVYSWDRSGPDYSFRGRSTYPGTVTSWDRFHALLGERVDVRLGHRLVDVVESDGRAGLRFENGHTDEADVVLFADGRKSFGRQRLDPDRKLTYVGYATWRGLIETPLGSGLEGFHRHYDPPSGTLFSITEPVIDDGRSYWEFSFALSRAAYERMTGKPPTELAFVLPHRVTPFIRAALNAAAKAYLPERFREVVSATGEVMGIPTLDAPVPAAAGFALGNAYAALIGDALHPVRLQVGAGLHLAVHQAADLIRHLRDADLTGWSRHAVDQVWPWIELGRSRAGRSNLGTYLPARPGWTAAPIGNAWGEPRWVPA
jgi:2-polyprenyl-6-methoxyphenol hydroxylase-like FAD-dependent oxidoreductase